MNMNADADTDLRNKALKAVDRVLKNLSDSDFVTVMGTRAVKELKKYREDMTIDIVNVFKYE